MYENKLNNLIDYIKNSIEELNLAIKHKNTDNYVRHSENCSSHARKASEALCKCIIIKSNLSDIDKEKIIQQDLNNLIQLVTRKKDSIIENNFIREKIYNRLNIIRTTGNSGSHENNYKLTEYDLDEITKALLFLTKWFFNEYNEEEIPIKLKPFYKTQNTFEFTMINDILSSKFNKTEKLFEKKKYKLKYELWKVHLMRDLYILFLDKDINITKTLSDFFRQLNLQIDFLTIITPHNVQERRIDNIKKFFDEYNDINKEKINDINVISLSDFIWENFSIDKKNIVDIYEEQYFLDQNIFEIDDKEALQKLEPSIDFLIQNFIEKEYAKPITLILGQGGVGKSTLTETLVNKINKNFEHRKAILIKAEILKNSLKDTIDNISFTIDSIFDLYNLYSKYIDNNALQFEISDKNIFNLSILSGNIILIIDGLDEISTLLKEKFILKNFIDSLITLNQQLGECRIIATARDSYWNKEKNNINNINVDIKYLFGFDEDNVNKYIAKRFGNNNKEIYINKFKSLLKDIIDKRTKQYLPFYINLIAGIIETNDDIDNLAINHSIKEYYHNEEILDFLIYSILNREIIRHNFSISIDTFIEVFLELVANYKNDIKKDDIVSILNLYFNDDNIIDKFMLNPLLKEENGKVNFRYDFLYNYFMNLYFIKSLKTKQIDNDFIKTFYQLYDGEHLLFDDLMKFFTKNESIQELKECHKKLINKYKTETNKSLKMKIEKTISALMYLVQKVIGENLSQDKRIDYIIEFYSREIRNLFIWGNFYPINLSNIKIYESKFINYNNICNCSTNENTKFYYSDISINNDIKHCHLDKKIFDSTCKINNKINEIFINYENNEISKRKIIEDELRRVFNHFYTGTYFENRKKDGCKFGKKLYMKESLISFLKNKNIIIDYDIRRYSISENYKPIISDFIKNNNSIKLKNLIDELMLICKTKKINKTLEDE